MHSEDTQRHIWQPSLTGKLITCLPAQASDWDDLFLAASDPLIWEQHPASNRYKQEVFQLFFQQALESQGALVIRERGSSKVIGSSRFINHETKTKQVEIGFTFLTRAHWGGKTNRELKNLMLAYAFQHVETVGFSIGANNMRSRIAIERRGAILVSSHTTVGADGKNIESVQYVIAKATFEALGQFLP